MRGPWECHDQSQETNWQHCVTGPELPYLHERKGILKINQSVKMPWHTLSMGVDPTSFQLLYKSCIIKLPYPTYPCMPLLISSWKNSGPPSNIIPKCGKWKFLTFIKEDPPSFWPFNAPMFYQKKRPPSILLQPPPDLNNDLSLKLPVAYGTTSRREVQVKENSICLLLQSDKVSVSEKYRDSVPGFSTDVHGAALPLEKRIENLHYLQGKITTQVITTTKHTYK